LKQGVDIKYYTTFSACAVERRPPTEGKRVAINLQRQLICT